MLRNCLIAFALRRCKKHFSRPGPLQRSCVRAFSHRGPVCVASFCVAALSHRKTFASQADGTFASQLCCVATFRVASFLRRSKIRTASQLVATQYFGMQLSRRNFFLRRARLRRNCSRRKTFAPQANAIFASQLFATQFLFECICCVATFLRRRVFPGSGVWTPVVLL